MDFHAGLQAENRHQRPEDRWRVTPRPPSLETNNLPIALQGGRLFGSWKGAQCINWSFTSLLRPSRVKKVSCFCIVETGANHQERRRLLHGKLGPKSAKYDPNRMMLFVFFVDSRLVKPSMMEHLACQGTLQHPVCKGVLMAVKAAAQSAKPRRRADIFCRRRGQSGSWSTSWPASQDKTSKKRLPSKKSDSNWPKQASALGFQASAVDDGQNEVVIGASAP